MAKAKPPTIFVSYSHKDQEWLDYLKSHLGPALRAGSFDLWDDTRLRGGDDWEAEIETAMRACRVCILLVSRHSLTSDYIDRVEMKTILERVAKDGVRIYPVFVSPVHVAKDHWLRKYNWRPRDGRPLKQIADDNGDRDATTVSIVDELVSVLEAKQSPRQVGAGSATPSVPARKPSNTKPNSRAKVRPPRATSLPLPATAPSSLVAAASPTRPVVRVQRSPKDILPVASLSGPFHDRGTFEKWLEAKPREVALVLGVRASLRILPATIGWELEDRSSNSLRLMAWMRGLAVSWVRARFPIVGMDALIGADFAARNVALALKTGGREYSAAPTSTSTMRALAADGAATVVLAMISVSTNPDVPVERVADVVSAVAGAAFAFAADHSAGVGMWDQLIVDAYAWEAGKPLSELLDSPLWTLREPLFSQVAKQDFGTALSSRAERWEPWTRWLEERFAGVSPDDEKEIARLTLPEDMWDEATRSIEGVKAVNAEIARRLGEIDERRSREHVKPQQPSAESGQSFKVAAHGLEAIAGPHPAACDAVTLRLHGEIRKSAAKVVDATAGIGNRFAYLGRTLEAYAAAISLEYEDLDVFAVWHTGIALIEMADAFRRGASAADSALDSEQRALLQTLAALHSNFTHRIPEIRDEFEVPEIARSSATVLAAIKPPMTAVLRNLRNLDRGVESKTKRLLTAVSIGYEATDGAFPEGVKSAYVSLSNVLIAISDHIDKLETATPAGCDGVLRAVVDTDPEDTRALVRFFRDNEVEIRAFSEPFSKLGIWIDWVYSRLPIIKGI